MWGRLKGIAPSPGSMESAPMARRPVYDCGAMCTRYGVRRLACCRRWATKQRRSGRCSWASRWRCQWTCWRKSDRSRRDTARLRTPTAAWSQSSSSNFKVATCSLRVATCKFYSSCETGVIAVVMIIGKPSRNNVSVMDRLSRKQSKESACSWVAKSDDAQENEALFLYRLEVGRPRRADGHIVYIVYTVVIL